MRTAFELVRRAVQDAIAWVLDLLQTTEGWAKVVLVGAAIVTVTIAYSLAGESGAPIAPGEPPGPAPVERPTVEPSGSVPVPGPTTQPDGSEG
jgi:hypothetical protein